MGRMKPWMVLTVDDERRKVLVKGEPAEMRKAVQAFGCPLRWSKFAKGYVVDSALVPDLVAYGQSLHELVVIGKRKPPTEQVSVMPEAGGAA